MIEKPPIGGKELLPLTNVQLAGFRLHPGPLPEQYRYLNTTPVRKHKKYKKSRHKDSSVPAAMPTDLVAEPHEKKHKKQKRHEDDKSERKKRKKEKKRKKQRHTPEPPATNVSNIIGSNNPGGGPPGIGF